MPEPGMHPSPVGTPQDGPFHERIARVRQPRKGRDHRREIRCIGRLAYHTFLVPVGFMSVVMRVPVRRGGRELRL